MHIDHYPVGIAAMLIVVLASCLGFWLVRRYQSDETLRANHEIGGYLVTIVGTLYAVLLGLVVIDSITKFQNASQVTEQEANALADVFLLADKLPEPNKKRIQKLCLDYTNYVINYEWDTMSDSKIYVPARITAINLIREINTFEPVTEGQKAIYPIEVQTANNLWKFRRARTNFVFITMPSIEWVALIAGGVIAIVFTYFFSIRSFRAQMIMTALLSGLISLNLYLVVLFGYPFSGDLKVSSDAFRVDRMIFQNDLIHLPKSVGVTQ